MMRARKVLDGALEARDRNKIQHFTILFIRFLQRQQLNALQLFSKSGASDLLFYGENLHYDKNRFLSLEPELCMLVEMKSVII